MERLPKMKKLFDKFSLTFRYAFKNIIFGKLKSLALVFIFILILVVTFLILSTRLFVSNYFNYQVTEKYGKFDIVMTVDENTNARFFSIRKLENEKIIDRVAFFEVNTIMSSEKLEYVKVMLGNLDGLKKVNSKVTSLNLNYNEIIITKYLAESFGLKLGDQVKIKFNDDIEYEVVEIVEDGGLFSKTTVFIDKDSNMQQILTAMNLTVTPEITKNIFTIAYLNVSNVNIIEEIKAIDDYKNLNITPTYNQELINQNINKATAAFGVVFLFVLIAILFVLQSTLSIIFKDRTKQIGIIKSIGSRSSFFLGLLLLETMIYLIIALVFASILSRTIINVGLSYLNSDLIFKLEFRVIAFGFIIVLALLYLIVFYNYLKIRNTSIISLSQDNKLIIKSRNIYYLIVFVGLEICNLLLNQDVYLKAIFSSFLGIVIGFLVLRLIVRFGKEIVSDYLFKTISIKNMSYNKTITYNLNIVLIAFLTIFIMIATINYNNRRIEEAYNDANVDFIITNIIHETSVVVGEVRSIENVLSADEGFLYRDVGFNDSDLLSDYMLSLNEDKIFDYFNLEVSSDVISKFSDTNIAYILLPISFKELNGYDVNDKVYLNINEEYNNEEFIVAGFFINDSNYFVLTNMANLTKYSSEAKNVILVNSNGNNTKLYQDLIEKFQSRLYYIIDFNIIISSIFEELNQTVSYFNYISYILIVCFIITIFNNSILIYNELKSTYAKLKIIGTSNKKLVSMIVKENLYLLILTLICSILTVLYFAPKIKDIVLLFDVYFPLKLVIGDIFEAIIVCVIVYLLSYIYYIKNVSKVNVVEEMKQIY